MVRATCRLGAPAGSAHTATFARQLRLTRMMEFTAIAGQAAGNVAAQCKTWTCSLTLNSLLPRVVQWLHGN